MASMARCTARFFVSARENSTPPRRQARTTARVPKAESPRTRIFRLAPAARAVAMAWAIMRPAPLPEPVLPARSRIPATTGAAVAVLIVVASGDSPLRNTCLPAILVWP
jgi:hypothetical protein